MSTRPNRTMAAALTGALLLAVSGCGGSGDSHSNEPRPASPVVISASVLPTHVTASPTTVGAGPISLVVANLSVSDQRVTLESADEPGTGGPGTTQTTQPIEPSGTTTIKADVDPGRYSVRVESDEIAPATIDVGAPRESAQNDSRPSLAGAPPSHGAPAALDRPCDAHHTGNDCALEILSSVEAIAATPTAGARRRLPRTRSPGSCSSSGSSS